MRAWALVALSAVWLAAPGEESPSPAASSVEPAPRRLDARHLPNAIQVCLGLISGGLPEGDAAFAELRERGIKTVISVDGAEPNVALAQRHGLRYVHLPHGYAGISTARARELAKALLVLEGPIYLHCHHGRHRSPAAAAVAAVGAGRIEPSVAAELLRLAGTSPDYRGLFAAVAAARPIPPAELAGLEVAFRETVPPPPSAEAMVAIDQVYVPLQKWASSGWVLREAAQLDEAAQRALLLREHLAEFERLPEFAFQPGEFQALGRATRFAALVFERSLMSWQAEGAAASRPPGVDPAWRELSARCTECHRRFRD